MNEDGLITNKKEANYYPKRGGRAKNTALCDRS